MIDQIDFFIRTSINRNSPFNSREWIETDNAKLYIRYTPKRYIDNKIITTIDIATISIHPKFQGQGIFTEILTFLETNYGLPIYIESILNVKLKEFLINRGYQEVNNTENCLILYT